MGQVKRESGSSRKHVKNDLWGKMRIIFLLGDHLSEFFCGDICVSLGTSSSCTHYLFYLKEEYSLSLVCNVCNVLIVKFAVFLL